LAAGIALGGCAARADAAPSIQLGTAYVTQVGKTATADGYLVIQNNGEADRLIAVKTSAGGLVTFSPPAVSGADARTVSGIRIPADSTLRLTPVGYHLLINGAKNMKSGDQITLKLTFAKAGVLSVAAEVTNPEKGGSSYLLN
jgi:copper(I)-binding protein